MSKSQAKLTVSNLDEWLRAHVRAKTCADSIPVLPNGATEDTYSLLDAGSQTSLILESLADKIGLDGENQSSLLVL